MDTHLFNLTAFLDAQTAHYRARGQRIAFLPYCYEADFLGGAGTQIVTTGDDADFIVCQQTFSAFTAAGVGVPSPDATVRITDLTAQRELSDRALGLLSEFGTGERPRVLLNPLLLPPKTTLQIVATYTGTDTLRLTLAGVKAQLARA